ncbi:ATP-binding protein [Streptomyces massasporeus]|uniref:ATP-binding protein n=1 Tax=Streptomyces massasporeus TaxID=67324 RepID=UPI0033DAA595
MQTRVALEGDGTDIARARHLAAGFLAQGQEEHGLAVSRRAMDVTQLVVSELVTNAYKHAPGPAWMELRITTGVVHVTVGGSDPVLPAARAADASRVGQHGLEIVRAVTEGFEAHNDATGKHITARIALQDWDISLADSSRKRRGCDLPSD